MSKYEPLWKYIKQNEVEVLTFDEVKKVLGFDIDHSFLNYKKELIEYGFEIKRISIKQKKINIKKNK